MSAESGLLFAEAEQPVQAQPFSWEGWAADETFVPWQIPEGFPADAVALAFAEARLERDAKLMGDIVRLTAWRDAARKANRVDEEALQFDLAFGERGRR